MLTLIPFNYFHAILAPLLTGRHPPLTISHTLLHNSHVLAIYSVSLVVSLNASFHASLQTSCIFSQLYLFHNCLSMFIPRFAIPLTISIHTPCANRSFVYAAPTLWNALDLDIRLLPFDAFKKRVKTHLYLKYSVN